MIEQHRITINGIVYIFTLYDTSGDLRSVQDYKPKPKKNNQLTLF